MTATALWGTTSMARRPEDGLVSVALSDGERILRDDSREISILLVRKELTITYARYAAGERIADAHVHHGHTDAFYVLEGELTFEIGREAKTLTVSAGAFVAAPPGVSHSFRNDSRRDARWLTIHAHDGGFAAFMAWATASASSGTSARCRTAAARRVRRSSAATTETNGSKSALRCVGWWVPQRTSASSNGE
jgi:quercetin dioxygenase-like cupin family protein